MVKTEQNSQTHFGCLFKNANIVGKSIVIPHSSKMRGAAHKDKNISVKPTFDILHSLLRDGPWGKRKDTSFFCQLVFKSATPPPPPPISLQS